MDYLIVLLCLHCNTLGVLFNGLYYCLLLFYYLYQATVLLFYCINFKLVPKTNRVNNPTAGDYIIFSFISSLAL